jgi:hypothetical protein
MILAGLLAADPAATVPAGTAIEIRVDQALSSRTAVRGDRFPISVVSPIIVDGTVIVPAGASGIGEVVHAAGKGFGGRAGELIVAARYVDVPGGRVLLRGFRINRAGANNAAEAIGATIMVPLAGLVVTGSSAQIALGQTAIAKTQADFPERPAPAAPPTPTDNQQGGAK